MPEAMCKVAFANLHSSFQTRAVGGSCKSHALNCTWAVAHVIHSANLRDLDKLKRPKRPLAGVAAAGVEVDAPDPVPDDFHINNLMFDETQLWLRLKTGNKKRRRVLASASQVTRRAPGATIVDMDVLRPPVEMDHYTAATCAAILGRPDDTAGLLPRGDAVPAAQYVGTLTAFDSHSVNKLISKWVSTEQEDLEPPRFHVASFCTQHKSQDWQRSATGLRSQTLRVPRFDPAAWFCFSQLLGHWVHL